MSEVERNKVASRRLYEEVFGRGNFDAADEILAEEAVSHGPGSPPQIGTEGIKRQGQALRAAFPDFTVRLNDQLAEGDRVCSRWTGSGTHDRDLVLPMCSIPASGKRVSFDEIRIDRFAEGRIVESWFIPDRFSLWSALGLISPPPTV